MRNHTVASFFSLSFIKAAPGGPLMMNAAEQGMMEQGK